MFNILDYNPKRVDGSNFSASEGDIVICTGGLVLLKKCDRYMVIGKVKLSNEGVCLDSIILGDSRVLLYKLKKYRDRGISYLDTLSNDILYYLVNVDEVDWLKDYVKGLDSHTL